MLSLVALALAATGCGSDDGAPAAAGVSTTTTASSGDSSTEPTAVRTFVGADGATSEVADTSRIVTLSGDLTEAVFALGFGDTVVGVDVTTVEPEAARSLPIVGVGRFLNAEAVLALEPTLVIGDSQTSPREAIEQVRSAGVPVAILDVPVSFDELYEKLRAVGELLGDGEAGVALADQVRAEVAQILEAMPATDPAPSIAFVYSRGPDVMLLFGAEMTTQPLIEAVGGIDVGAATGVTGTVTVTPEALIAAAPDVIITTTEGLAALGGVDEFLAIPGIAETPAGRSGAVLDYPEGDILTFGPRIAESLELLADELAATRSGS